ncbi:MAG: ATP-binding protein, partial [Gracilibacteraceae bacterium]|nr:ATP-binding protein [Gracilibacteraceae bacterium]
NSDLNEKFRKTLKAFYSVLKKSNLRFSLLTGVTKFSKVSVFSDLNHLSDISMNYKYTNICGITAGELWDNFEPELRQLAERAGITIEETMAEMQKRYDGYHFCENTEGLYNPFSLLRTLDEGKFNDYWFETGTPTFLIKLLERDRFDLSGFAKGVTVSANSITDYRADGNDPVPILYQSGYLTIKNYDKEYNEYLLDFPNEEVRGGFLNELLRSYVPDSNSYAKSFKRALLDGNLDRFMETARTFFAGIPYDLNDRAAAAQKEGYYQGLVYAILTLTGLTPAAEKRSAAGRADLVAETKDAVYIFEFKLNKSVDEALRQIEEKDYAAPYAMANKKIVKIGVNFDSKTRNIADWRMAEPEDSTS